ncbi:MAG: phage virion morphogenesis protein [Candidatus Ratteibacteria bacterium]
MENRAMLMAIGAKIDSKIKKRIRENKIKPSANKQNNKATLVETGNLLRSITYTVRGDTIYIGTNVKYARIHHEGGTIRPQRAKFLAIPLTPAAKVKRPLEWENTFIQKGIIFHTLKNGKLEALYKLKKSVEIPARPYMFVDKQDIAQIEEMVRKYVKNMRSK